MDTTASNPLPPTEPIKLPMHDQFGDYFTTWVHDAKAKNEQIINT